MLGSIGKVVASVVSRFDRSFPQYTVGHLDRVDTIEESTSKLRPPVALAGSSYRGIGVPACIASGRRAARRVSEALA